MFVGFCVVMTFDLFPKLEKPPISVVCRQQVNLANLSRHSGRLPTTTAVYKEEKEKRTATSRLNVKGYKKSTFIACRRLVVD